VGDSINLAKFYDPDSGSTSAVGPSRHFIAPQRSGRFQGKADIEPCVQSQIHEYTA
jgi:hypothetical protein